MQINLPDAPLHQGIPIFGNVVSNREFQGVVTHGLFKDKVPDPRRLEGTLAKYNTDLSGYADLRRKVNRLITGAKRGNVQKYAAYIINMVKTGEGFTPQIVLWSPQPLRVERDEMTGLAWILVPHELKFIALDGDTQTTARNLADGMMPGLLDKQNVKVVVCHGISEEEAANIFATCNVEGTKVSTSLALGMDTRDDATQLAKYVEANVPALKNKVNRQKRQLGSTDLEVVTMSALRASAVCFVQGINGVQNQTKAVSIDDHLDNIQAGAVKWFDAVTQVLNGALDPAQRAETFAASPAVWCAIGALGHDVMVELAGEDFDKAVTPAAVEHAFKAAAEQKLGSIDWARGPHWLTVGVKQSLSGKFVIGGPKESASLLYKAFKDGTLQRKPAGSKAA